MAEIVEPGVLQTAKPKRKLRLKITDVIAFAVILAVIAVLVVTLHSKLQLKHDVSGAKVVSDKVIADIYRRDGMAVRSLGSSSFKSNYSAQQLTAQFKAIKVATSQMPKLDRQMVASGNKGRHVYFIYKYSTFKVPYYIRTALAQKNGVWQLITISGSVDESKLIIN